MKFFKMVCAVCRRADRFTGGDIIDAATKARAAGWIVRDGRVLCPKCAAKK